LVCFLPTQAKILHTNNKYPTISHKVNSIYQIESLIRYSNLNGGIPLYLLYNYYAATPTLTMYGAALVNANYIKHNFFPLNPNINWKIPSFSELCPSNAIPISWLCRLCNSLNISDFAIFNGLDRLPTPNITSNNWRLIDAVNELNPNNNQELISNNDCSFNPKYRIQIEVPNGNRGDGPTCST